MSDRIVSWIRTVVPAAIAAGLTLLAKRTGIILDADTSQALTLGVTGLVLAIYYPVIRWAEARWPQVGWLLGNPKTPSYAPTVALAAHIDHQGYTHAEIVDAIEACDGDMRRFTALIDRA